MLAVSRCAALVSILAAALVLTTYARVRTVRSEFSNSFVLYLTLNDLVASVLLAIGGLDTSGTVRTHQDRGGVAFLRSALLQHALLSSVLWSSCIALNHLLLVRLSKSVDSIRRVAVYEHAFVWSASIGTNIAIWRADAYGDGLMWSWCGFGTSREHAHVALYVVYLPIIACITFNAVAYAIILRHGRRVTEGITQAAGGGTLQALLRDQTGGASIKRPTSAVAASAVLDEPKTPVTMAFGLTPPTQTDSLQNRGHLATLFSATTTAADATTAASTPTHTNFLPRALSRSRQVNQAHAQGTQVIPVRGHKDREQQHSLSVPAQAAQLLMRALEEEEEEMSRQPRHPRPSIVVAAPMHESESHELVGGADLQPRVRHRTRRGSCSPPIRDEIEVEADATDVVNTRATTKRSTLESGLSPPMLGSPPMLSRGTSHFTTANSTPRLGPMHAAHDTLHDSPSLLRTPMAAMSPAYTPTMCHTPVPRSPRVQPINTVVTSTVVASLPPSPIAGSMRSRIVGGSTRSVTIAGSGAVSVASHPLRPLALKQRYIEKRLLGFFAAFAATWLFAVINVLVLIISGRVHTWLLFMQLIGLCFGGCANACAYAINARTMWQLVPRCLEENARVISLLGPKPKSDADADRDRRNRQTKLVQSQNQNRTSLAAVHPIRVGAQLGSTSQLLNVPRGLSSSPPAGEEIPTHATPVIDLRGYHARRPTNASTADDGVLYGADVGTPTSAATVPDSPRPNFLVAPSASYPVRLFTLADTAGGQSTRGGLVRRDSLNSTPPHGSAGLLTPQGGGSDSGTPSRRSPPESRRNSDANLHEMSLATMHQPASTLAVPMASSPSPVTSSPIGRMTRILLSPASGPGSPPSPLPMRLLRDHASRLSTHDSTPHSARASISLSQARSLPSTPPLRPRGPAIAAHPIELYTAPPPRDSRASSGPTIVRSQWAHEQLPSVGQLGGGVPTLMSASARIESARRHRVAVALRAQQLPPLPTQMTPATTADAQ